MPSIRFNKKHGFNVRFSPLFPKFIACVTCENFGFKGRGSLVILENDGSEHLSVRKNSSWSNGLLDVSWLRADENILITSSCDGSLQLWKLFGRHAENPVNILREHILDVPSLDTNGYFISSASWDSTIKIWDIRGSKSSITTMQGEGDGVIHSVKWSRSFPNLLLSVSERHHLVLWDRSSPKCSLHKIESKHSESLDCDWSHLDPYLAGVCDSRGGIKLWDIRRLNAPRNQVTQHREALAKIKFSPHYPDVIATSSYNLSTAIWNIRESTPLEIIRHHSGFILGLDFNENVPGEMADSGLDSLVHVFTPWSLFQFNFHPAFKNKL